MLDDYKAGLRVIFELLNCYELEDLISNDLSHA